jgi:hypothetical protein
MYHFLALLLQTNTFQPKDALRHTSWMSGVRYGNGVNGYTRFTIRILAARMMMFISKPMRMKSLKR